MTYRVRYEVRGCIDYVVEAANPTDAYLLAEAMEWSDGDLNIDQSDAEVSNQDGEWQQIDWERVDRINDGEEEGETRLTKA